MKKILVTTLLVWMSLHLALAQNTCVNVPHIKTLQVIANDNWMTHPIIYLNTPDKV